MKITFKKNQGITLIELMVVVAVVAIIASFAIPSYQESVRKGKRTDGKTALMDLSSRLEQFYLDNKTYTTDLTKLGFSVANNADSQDQHYKLTVAGCPIGTCFTASAVPQGGQSGDSCGTLTLTSAGVKGPNSDCW